MIYPRDINEAPIGTRCHVGGDHPFVFDLISKENRGRYHLGIEMRMVDGTIMRMKVKKTFVVAYSSDKGVD